MVKLRGVGKGVEAFLSYEQVALRCSTGFAGLILLFFFDIVGALQLVALGDVDDAFLGS